MVALKERIQCSASSIAAASSGEREKWRWSTQGAVVGMERRSMTWVPTRLDLKAWRDWNDVKTSSIGMEEVVVLVVDFLMEMTADLMALFDWEAIELEQGRFDGK